MSELGKVRHLLTKYCYTPDGQPAVGLEVASQGDPLAPWFFQLDLPPEEFAHYNSGNHSGSPYQLYGYGHNLPIANESIFTLSAFHILEDYIDWKPVLREWCRVIKPGGYLIIGIPDRILWAEALRLGQPCNCAHKHEGYPGELSAHVGEMNLPLRVLEDRQTNLPDVKPIDYGIIFVAQKL